MDRLRGTVAVLLVGLISVAGCGGGESTADDPPETPRTQPADRTPERERTPAGDERRLPDLVGKGLQFAQDRAQAAGFQKLWSHDALGRNRQQVNDRAWQVCFQEPGPGPVDPTTEIDFGVVKLGEQCPDGDRSKDQPTVEDGKLPDFTGASVEVAHRALGLDASVAVGDASDQDRTVWVERNWRVCSQSPAAGTAWDGEPVTLRAVKYGESCP